MGRFTLTLKRQSVTVATISSNNIDKLLPLMYNKILQLGLNRDQSIGRVLEKNLNNCKRLITYYKTSRFNVPHNIKIIKRPRTCMITDHYALFLTEDVSMPLQGDFSEERYYRSLQNQREIQRQQLYSQQLTPHQLQNQVSQMYNREQQQIKEFKRQKQLQAHQIRQQQALQIRRLQAHQLRQQQIRNQQQLNRQINNVITQSYNRRITEPGSNIRIASDNIRIASDNISNNSLSDTNTIIDKATSPMRFNNDKATSPMRFNKNDKATSPMRFNNNKTTSPMRFNKSNKGTNTHPDLSIITNVPIIRSNRFILDNTAIYNLEEELFVRMNTDRDSEETVITFLNTLIDTIKKSKSKWFNQLLKNNTVSKDHKSIIESLSYSINPTHISIQKMDRNLLVNQLNNTLKTLKKKKEKSIYKLDAPIPNPRPQLYPDFVFSDDDIENISPKDTTTGKGKEKVYN